MTEVLEGASGAGGEKQPWLTLDSDDMLGAAAALPDHLEEAIATRPATAPLEGRVPFSSVVVAGMGGSGVAGRVLKALADRRSRVPVVLAGGYDLPNFVGQGSLVIAVSFSGGTEETLSAAHQALDRGAGLLAVTTGGALGELARRAASGGGGEGTAALELLPDGIAWPRAGVGAMVARLLRAAEALGVLPAGSATDELVSSVAQLRRRLPECQAGGGLAAEVAARIGRTFPLFHGAAGLGEVAARRWKTQVNENAKAPAFSGEQPEVCHNELCGFGQGGDVTRQLLTLVGLRLGTERRQVARRFELFGELAGEALAGVVDVVAAGEGELARFFDLVMLGDFLSLHLAGRDGVDPGPVPILGEIKARLAEGAEAGA